MGTSQLCLAEKAKQQIELFVKSRKAIEDEAKAQNQTVSNAVVDKIAYDMARQSFEEQHK